ncbi:hypothetical protein LEP1GSC173_0928 [Leptospira interrogans str. HAI1594]|uniref:Uncharacterized protein n=1 Tax=Leptospira interrogans serovar Zanoni str. LT2156 TaxID=1001601 RepID=M6HQN0_LEPIR|nr:hypothetical protein LEP1GSC117_3898 [Leptospira interrogans serovar Icterohaemorrhagiae str. Verdun LP]EKP74900.1 hypothetical protein LEP1GSC173_0928 [Leptospira interrogans str. HAI1594]EMM97284.1 hypothetical protein LEP1GSC158_2646 [Leptospira interrogans serovar Zanoni str. LT2156]EMO16854.1 hypothetical protein LEP1GSC167_2697 [Leptospira interrogans serovar Copenhageni str. HAI0188]EMO38410.1 hypothetical protein LEP1GSC177_3487 [Leptospira interrogans str. MMD3731]EMY53400.1 hypoth
MLVYVFFYILFLYFCNCFSETGLSASVNKLKNVEKCWHFLFYQFIDPASIPAALFRRNFRNSIF